jgi:O-antigen ligase
MRTARESPAVSFLFLAAVFCASFDKVHWAAAGTIYLSDVTTILFLIVWGLSRVGTHRHRVPQTVGVLIAFFIAFLLVYLIGYFNLDTKDALDQFGKGIVKWLIHFIFLIVAVAYVAGKGKAYYWKTLTWFLGGITFNAAYGILQLAAAQAGHNLDSLFVKPITRGASAINIYGQVQGANVYRPNALTGDPNHLGIMLLTPILILAPIYLRLEQGHRLKRKLAVLIAFLLLAELATLSRSGGLGLIVGAIVLLIPYRRLVWSRAAALPLVLVAIPVGVVLFRKQHFFETVIRSRVATSGKGTSTHFAVYSFIPSVLHMHPLFGLGYNNFSVYYEFVTGKTNWGPHSYYVSLLVEGGLVGTLLFLGFLFYVFLRLRFARRIGKALASVGNPDAARVRPLAWGMTAALLGTMAANAFYLTLSFFYFFVFCAMALVTPIIFGRSLTTAEP